jgi:flavin reductase (DIM6/NTAB) family NADH-FMN oxidoreductase RutF
MSFIPFDPQAMSVQDVYKLMIGSIVPRPIAFVSTRSLAGVDNLAPYSFFNGVCSNPPTVMFSIMRRGSDGAKKDTLLNIEETREYVINIVTEAIVGPMNQASAELPMDASEFDFSGLTPIPSDIVRAPRVLESPISLECRLQQLVPVGDGGVGSGCVVLGTVVRFHVREDVTENGRILIERLKPVARLAGTAYCPVRETFDLPRPALPTSLPTA